MLSYQLLTYTQILILARCVFVGQIAICRTKTLAPKGVSITPKSRLKNSEIDEKKEYRQARW